MVVGAEMSSHMADTGCMTMTMNGYARQCTMFAKDVRRMDTEKKPDGTGPDMQRKADLVIFEVEKSRIW